MSQKRLNKKTIKIAGATSIALFSLVTVFTATFAWFVLSNKTFATGMSIKASDEEGRLNKIEIFEYKETVDKGGISNYSFENTPALTIYGGDSAQDDYYQMGDFNPLSPEHPVLILFTLKDDYVSTSPGDMYIRGLTNATGFLGATENGQPKYNLGSTAPTLKRGTKTVTIFDPLLGGNVTKTVDCYPLSSAVNFKGAEYSSNQYETLKANSTSGRIDVPTNSITKRGAFVNFATTGEGITFDNNPTIFSSLGEGETIKYIALVVNYDEDAIFAIYSTYLGNSVLENEYEGLLYFTCDWSLEVF